MAMNFPDPVEGAVFTDSTTGAQFIYKNGVWMQASAAQIKLTANDQNIVVNGGFQISQENGTTAVGNNLYPADQWQYISAGAFSAQAQLFYAAHGRWSVASQNGAVLASPGAATDFFIPLYQSIEGLRMIPLRWGTSYAIPAVLNFKAAVTRDGVYGCAIKGGGNDRFIGFDVPITAAEGLKEFTFAVPPPVGGTWPTTSAYGAYLAFSHTLGSSFKAAAHGVWQNTNCNGGPGMTNNAAALSSSLQISDVQLLADPFGTGIAPPFMLKPWVEDLRECQRYFQRLLTTFSGNTSASSNYYTMGDYPVQPRTTPVLSGVDANAAGFPAASGALVNYTIGVREGRLSTGGTSAIFTSTITVNAR